MLLRMSSLFVRTLREDPADAEVPSHKLLVRAGYVRRVSPGVYSWLPLGKLVLDNVARVIREEMVRIGGQEVLLPSLLPRDYYDASGRWTEYGPDMFRLRDRKGADHCLGPTHEEAFTLVVKDLYASYRGFPVTLFQIQTKFRDEARPRAGVLRGREFLMKDSYSFDLTDDGLATSYTRHREAYQRIFDRLGVRYAIVAALPGAMGGAVTEEFQAETPFGEDTYVACTACEYAANTEALVTPAPPASDTSAHPPLQELDTPGTPTIESLVDHLNSASLGRRFTAADTLKNVVVKLRRPGSDDAEVLVIGVPGDREVDFKRLEGAVYPATVEMFEAADFADRPALVRGYIGPQGLRGQDLRYLVDPRVVPGTSWVTGANAPDQHAVNVVCGRDFTPDGTIEAAEVRTGDLCPRCGAALRTTRGIEIGQIFQLGQRYADTFELDVLGPDGRPVRVTMGSYGIGISRAVAAVVEQTYDERGLCWPREIAPCDVHIVAAGKDDQQEAALVLAEDLAGKGTRVLLDDRTGVSAGVKFTDAELLGMPTVVVVGRGLAGGLVELRDRRSGTRRDVSLAEIADLLAPTAD